ncbi:hypothetical protein R3P38DRAFT_3155934 [Favolaschia claudopus]|uniref:Chromo domain-containing protein n=1 Tax=Favolaschia claudopus TaxID=2862362 RepID=A0AAV9YYJ3_9AGAR
MTSQSQMGIIDKRVENKELEYLVRWKGYDSDDDSWVGRKRHVLKRFVITERKSARNKRQRSTTPSPAKPVKLSRHQLTRNVCVRAETPVDDGTLVPMQPILPQLLRRWMEAPLCHYLVARESVLSALTLLCQFPSALPFAQYLPPKGLLRCCLDWPAVLGPLALQSVVSDVPYSTRTPLGWISSPCNALSSLGLAIVHCDGEALWLVWPGTPSNLRWWTRNHRHPSHGIIPEAIKALDGLELMYLTEPCSFVLPPFAMYRCIGFSLASYTCVSFASAAHWTVAQNGLESFNDEAPIGGCALDVLHRILAETQTWGQILQPAGLAANYLTEWKSPTQRIVSKGAADDGGRPWQLKRSRKYPTHSSVSDAINAALQT